jgi:hypothetical protein
LSLLQPDHLGAGWPEVRKPQRNRRAVVDDDDVEQFRGIGLTRQGSERTIELFLAVAGRKDDTDA